MTKRLSRQERADAIAREYVAAQAMSLTQLLKSRTAFPSFAAYHAAAVGSNYRATIRYDPDACTIDDIREAVQLQTLAERLALAGYALFWNGRHVN